MVKLNIAIEVCVFFTDLTVNICPIMFWIFVFLRSDSAIANLSLKWFLYQCKNPIWKNPIQSCATSVCNTKSFGAFLGATSLITNNNGCPEQGNPNTSFYRDMNSPNMDGSEIHKWLLWWSQNLAHKIHLLRAGCRMVHIQKQSWNSSLPQLPEWRRQWRAT